jgi:hypothetical protein
VSLSYRRGLQQLVVTTRLVGRDRGAWEDPVSAIDATRSPQPVTFSGGALDGLAGEIVLDPTTVPHLWALGDDLVVTIAGDLSGAELVQVAESLEPR